MSTQAVGGNLSASNKKQINKEKQESLTVKPGETLSSIAKKFSMSIEEFRQWTGLKKQSVNVGQVIKFPTDVVPDGKGIMALIRKYNMTFEEFGKLNNLPKPYREYIASKGEKFYVKPSKVDTKGKTSTSAKTQAPTQAKTISRPKPKPKATGRIAKSAAAAGASVGATVGSYMQKIAKWGSSYTPNELATNIYTKAEEHWGAVGKPDFDALIKEINPKNAEAVIKAYPKNSKNTKRESLINTITSEIRSDKELRKKAAMHVYNALATAKKAPESKRKEFQAELNKQFDKLIGMVDTTKLDSMIAGLSGKAKVSRGSATPQRVKAKAGTSKSGQIRKSILKAAQKEISDAFYKSRTDSRGITVPSYIDQMVAAVNKNSTLTPTQKQQQIAKIRKAKVNISTISRPFPNVDKSGKIDNTPKVTEFKPTGKSNGKVILLNEGHGGFTGSAFDGGAYSFQERPKGSNTYYPIEEFQVVKPYSRGLTKKLQAKGYTVVTFAGEVTNMANRQLVQKLTAKYTKKFGQNNAMLISLHSDSGTSKGSGVLYDKRDAKDTALATSINKALNKQSWISAKPAERPYEEVDTKTKQKKLTHSLYVLTKSHGIPSNLLEIEYLGGVRSLNLTSSDYRKQFVNGTLEGIENYFKSAH
ncbi:MAG: N-acetylmuramoyl-L-alanine amidase [Cyanobacteriota bacterium]|nr:N-acetylmuramoyl-L-alanine amidase [Cyanobacteriota bacterium]